MKKNAMASMLGLLAVTGCSSARPGPDPRLTDVFLEARGHSLGLLAELRDRAAASGKEELAREITKRMVEMELRFAAAAMQARSGNGEGAARALLGPIGKDLPPPGGPGPDRILIAPPPPPGPCRFEKK